MSQAQHVQAKPMTKLPKQFKRWLYKAGVRLQGGYVLHGRGYLAKLGKEHDIVLKGRGCRFLIPALDKNSGDMSMLLGEVHETFNKWRDSHIAWCKLPKDEQSFVRLIRSLAEVAKQYKAEGIQLWRDEDEGKREAISRRVAQISDKIDQEGA